MITEIDIWRAAHLMLRWYGDLAQQESIRRIDKLSATADVTGVAIWLRTIEAIDELANIAPPEPAH